MISYSIIQQDITTLNNVDVIVNAANEKLFHGTGVSGAIHKAAGNQLDKECKDYIIEKGPLKVSGVYTSQSYNLKEQGIKHIIHVVGPFYNKFNEKQSESELEQAIKNVLDETFIKLEMNFVAIPAISSGVYGFPIEKCAQVFKRTILNYIHKNKNMKGIIQLCTIDFKTCNIFTEVFGSSQSVINPIQQQSQNNGENSNQMKSGIILSDSSQQEKIAFQQSLIVKAFTLLKQELVVYGTQNVDIIVQEIRKLIIELNLDIVVKLQDEIQKSTNLNSIKDNEIAQLRKNLQELQQKNQEILQNSSPQKYKTQISMLNEQIDLLTTQLQNSRNELNQCKNGKNYKIFEEKTQALGKQIQKNKEQEDEINTLNIKLIDLDKYVKEQKNEILNIKNLNFDLNQQVIKQKNEKIDLEKLDKDLEKQLQFCKNRQQEKH